MKVILLQDVERVGKQGEVLNVRDGYARNYLLPKKKAVVALPAQLKRLDEVRKHLFARQSRLAQQLAAKKAKLEQLTLKAELRMGDEGKAFGAITNAEIAELLAREQFTVDKHDVLLEEPIKEPGVHDVEIRLGPETRVVVKLWVTAQAPASTSSPSAATRVSLTP
jgi:large subunit ribosomal protein L9